MGQRYTRPLTYAGIDTDQIRGIKFYGVLKGKNNLIIYEKYRTNYLWRCLYIGDYPKLCVNLLGGVE